jgi:hypothetical protein
MDALKSEIWTEKGAKIESPRLKARNDLVSSSKNIP